MPATLLSSARPARPAAARLRARIVSTVAMLLCLTLATASGAAAVESPAEVRALLEVAKVVTSPTGKVVQSGGEVNWSITVNCQSDTIYCWDTALTDVIPAPFEYVPGSVNYVSDGVWPAPTVTEPSAANGQTLTAVFNDVSSGFPGKKGLASGHGMTFSLTAKLPATSQIPAGGQEVPNTATLASSDEFVQDDSSTDTARIEFVPVLQPHLTKTWSEDVVVAGAAGLVGVSLDASHTSNLPAQALVITDPAAGSAAFDEFSFVAFTGFTMPASADQVTVSLALQGGTSETFPASASLPDEAAVATALASAGKTLADVVGVTATVSHSSGVDVIAAEEHAVLSFSMAQRATLTADQSPVTNTASATVATTGFGEETTESSDSITVEPPVLSARATKVYTSASGGELASDAVIVTGEAFGARATVRSIGNVPLDSLTVSDPAQRDAAVDPATYDFAAQGVTFVGFGTDGSNTLSRAGVVPSGATGATVTYTYADDGDGATAESGTFSADLATSPAQITFPEPDAGRTVLGFSVNFTGNLTASAVSAMPYALLAGPDATTARNSADGEVLAGSASAIAAPAIDEVNIVTPHVESRTDKAITPANTSVDAGATFVSVLTSRLDAIDGSPLSNVPVNTLTIEDSINTPPTTGTSVWDSSFRPTGLTASALPAGVRASVEVLVGGSWSTPSGLGSVTGAIPATTFATAVDGVRVTYVRSDGTPLDESQRYRTLVEWTAATANPPAVFRNLAVSQASGTNPADGTEVVGDRVADSDDITTTDGPGPGGDTVIAVETSKTWTSSDAPGSRALEVPLWVPNSGDYPTFGLRIGVQNDSKHEIPVDSLTLQEPAIGAQLVDGATVAQSNPFDAIQLVTLSDMTVPESADAATLSATLTPSGAAATTIVPAAGGDRAANIASVMAQVNAFLATHTDVVSVAFDVAGAAGGINTGEPLNAGFATAVREVRLSGAAIDPIDLTDNPLTVDNVVSAAAEYGEYSAAAAALDSLEIRALSTQEVSVQAIKSLSPDTATILSSGAGPTTTMVLGANKFTATATAPDADSYSNPISYELTDITPAFWDIFDLAGLTGVVGEPSGSSVDVRFGVEYRIGNAWLLPEDAPSDGWDVPQGSAFQAVPAGATLAPAGQSFDAVEGVRVKFWTADGSSRLPDMSTSSSNLSGYGQKLQLAFDLRPTFRASGEPIPDGTAITNTVEVAAVNAQGNQATDSASASFSVTSRTSDVTITKTPLDQTLPAGAGSNFVLTLRNTGTTAVRDLVLTDTIACVAGQPDVIYDPEVSAITLGTGGTDAPGVTTDLADAVVTYDQGCTDGSDTVSIALPEADTVWPGETYAVTVPLTVRAGHAPGDFENSYDLTYVDELGQDSVGPAVAQIQVPVAQGYWFTKYVREVVDTDAGEELTGITGICQGDEADYLSGALSEWQRTPCVVQTQPGGTEEWRLWLTNAGNLPTKSLVAVDVLPTPGDVGITTGLSHLQRGSTFTPTLLAGIDVEWLSATQGTLAISYQTAADGSCVLSGDEANEDPFSPDCLNWRTDWDSVKDDAAVLATVTALKFEVTYPDDALLQPSESVKISFRTQNPEELPAGAPLDDAPAWNSFGGWAQTVTNPLDAAEDFRYSYFRTAPLKAGVAISNPDPALALGDRAWVDVNSNGVQDESEPGLAGVGVTLHRLDGTVLSSTTTDDAGYYVFEGLYPGTYTVSFHLTEAQRALYSPTVPLKGRADVDSDIGREAAPDGSFSSGTVRITYPSRGDSDALMSASEYNALGLQSVADGSYIDPTVDAGFVLIEADEPSAIPVPVTPDPAGPSTTNGALSSTGAETSRALGVAAALLLAGIVLVAMRRRRG
ncbi:SdrD B-like domain-containing protein [Demequina aurantiaca]|uniref:SdrD B-like domain-containing protein n=1 Tax=Demequina aurantiaca TaxID=676200 RepID=UPI003D333577